MEKKGFIKEPVIAKGECVNSITLAIVGSGGAGVVSLGELILKAAGSVGFYGLMRKSFGPQIRGGESAAILRIANEPVHNFSGDMHCLIALDWNNFSRFGDEIPVDANTIILQDQVAGNPPPALAEIASIQTLDLTAKAESVGSSKANMVLLGFIGALLQCDSPKLEVLIRKRLSKLDASLQSVTVAAMESGYRYFEDNPLELDLPVVNNSGDKKLWIATGNQLAGLGALEAGVKFVAAYPITPASDCLEWVAGRIETIGGHLVQAEDELSAINMIIGAGYSGVPCMTATSGPGLALMSEAMGLAVASETPTVILNVMRGGPSTGIPTKSEQSDFNLAVYGLHGDAPHVVVSALSIDDCYASMAWAVKLATQLQTLVIVLSDQFIGQSIQIMSELPSVPFTASTENKVSSVEPGYARYLDTDSGVSPMAFPGVANGMYTADGLEHTENAIPSPKNSEHIKQLNKRARKLAQYDFSEFWGEIEGEGDHLLVCWGSTYTAAVEAQRLLAEEGIRTKVVGVRQLSPLPESQIIEQFKDAKSATVIELNHQAQFAHYLKSFDLPGVEFESYARPGPNLISPNEIVATVKQQINAEVIS